MAVKIEMRPAVQEDAWYIARHLREADLVELNACSPMEPTHLVQHSMVNSVDPQILYINDVPAAVGGICANTLVNFEHGTPWMLGTELIEKYPIAFIKAVLRYFNKYEARYTFQENYVHANNLLSIRFIEAMGYTVEKDNPQRMGWKNEPFCRFYKELH